MRDKPKSMRVTEKSLERFCYLAESASEPDVAHTVDLTANEGLGACTCMHYQTGVAKNQRRAIALNKLPQEVEYVPCLDKQREGLTQCRHIWGAERHWRRNHDRPFRASFVNGWPKGKWADVLRRFLTWKGEKS